MYEETWNIQFIKIRRNLIVSLYTKSIVLWKFTSSEIQNFESIILFELRSALLSESFIDGIVTWLSMLIAYQSINESGDEPRLWRRKAINGFDRCANVAQVNETIDWPFVEGRGRCNPTAVLKWNYFDIGFDRLHHPPPRCLFEKPLHTGPSIRVIATIDGQCYTNSWKHVWDGISRSFFFGNINESWTRGVIDSFIGVWSLNGRM